MKVENLKIEIVSNPYAEVDKAIDDFLNVEFFSPKDLLNEELKDRFCDKEFAYVVAKDGDKIVGSINLFKRSIKFEDRDILVGGIGGVCTAKAYRGNGIATQMMKLALEFFKDQEIDIACLNSDPDDVKHLYTNTGFVYLKQNYLSTGKSGKIYDNDFGMIAPVCSLDKFNLILNSNIKLDLQGPDW